MHTYPKLLTFKDLQKVVESQPISEPNQLLKRLRGKSFCTGIRIDIKRETEQPGEIAALIILLAFLEKMEQRNQFANIKGQSEKWKWKHQQQQQQQVA